MKRRDWFKGLAASLGAFAVGNPDRGGGALAGEESSRQGRKPRFIDIHVHTSKPRHPKVTRPNGSHYPSPRTLIEMMDGAGIDLAVVQAHVSPECSHTIVTTEEVLEICGQYPGRLVPFCNLDPRFLNNSPKGKVTPGRVVELMRRYPNLHGDLSAGSGFTAISRDPKFGYKFMEEFQDRLYWATDIANDPQNLPIVDYFLKLKAEKPISAAAYEKITWRNADRLLKLGFGS